MLYVYVGYSKPDLISQRNTQMLLCLSVKRRLGLGIGAGVGVGAGVSFFIF